MPTICTNLDTTEPAQGKVIRGQQKTKPPWAFPSTAYQPILFQDQGGQQFLLRIEDFLQSWIVHGTLVFNKTVSPPAERSYGTHSHHRHQRW